MTYPPQQGGGYGPLQGGGQHGHQQGGYQQGYPGPGGGYAPPGGPPGYGPPRRSKTPLIIGIVAAVLVIGLVVALLLWFSGDDEPAPTGANKGSSGQSGQPSGGPATGGQVPGSATSGPSAGPGSGGAGNLDEVANQIIATINNQDFDAIDGLSCDASSAAGLKREMANLQGLDVTATLDDVQESGSAGSVDLTITGEGLHQPVSIEMSQNDGQWCAEGV